MKRGERGGGSVPLEEREREKGRGREGHVKGIRLAQR